MNSILFVIPTLSGGGAEKVLVNLVNELSYRYSITLLTLFDVGVNKSSLSSRVNYQYVFRWNFRGNIYLFKMFTPSFLCKLFIRGDYDYVVAFLEYSTTRILSGYSGRAKKIAWIHSTVNDYTLKEFLSPYRSKEECIKCYNKYDKIVGVSQDVLKSFFDKFPEVHTLSCVRYNIVNSKNIQILSQEKVESEFLLSDRIKICSVGRLIPVKGYLRLLKVYLRLMQEHIALNTHLYILGVGAEQTSLEKYITENDMTSYVTLLGYKKNPYKYIRNMDLFVCSSYSEGLSTAVTESLLLGVPILTTNCSGMNELLDNGNCGLIVENTELGLYTGLKKMILDNNLRQHYKDKAIIRREFFDDVHVLNEVSKLF